MKTNPQDPLANIMFVSIPEHFHHQIGSFEIDPSRLLPVELPPGQVDNWTFDDLSWEQIIAAMLKLLAYKPDHEDADYYREFVMAAKPDIGVELTQSGIIKAKNKDFDIAVDIFKALAGLMPDDPRPILNLALVFEQRSEHYSQMGKEDLAEENLQLTIEHYKAALAFGEQLPEALLNAGYFYLKIQNYARGISLLRDYLKMFPESEHGKDIQSVIDEIEKQNLMDQLFKEAYDFIKLNKEEEGIAAIKEFIRKNPDVWNAWFILGWGLRRIKSWEEARVAFDKALSLGGNNGDVHNELAICHLELGQFPEARKHLLAALKLEPENTKIISNLGILALKSGNETEAAGYFRTVLEYDPEDTLAIEYLNMMEN